MNSESPELIDTGPALKASGLVHRVLQPEGAGPHPTVVMLHGRLGNEDVMWIFARALPDNWLIVAPRAIEAESGPEGEGYSWHPPHPEPWPHLSQFDEAVTAVYNFIQALPDLYQANLNQIYLMGFSQGAALAFATAIQYPKLIQGIAGLVGFVPVGTDEAIANAPLRNLPVFIAVGKEDATIPLDLARASAETIRAAGAYLEYREYDTGHKLNSQGMRKLRSWWAERQEAG